MKWWIFIFSSLGFFAHGENFQTLGLIGEIPTNSQVEFLRNLPNDQVELRYQNSNYSINRHEFLHSVESQAPQQVLADLFEDRLSTVKDVGLCPLGSDGKLKPGLKWNYASAQLLVEHCEPKSVRIVRRTWSSDWKSNCRPASRDLSAVVQWQSCAPPPACTAAQALLKYAGAKERLEAWKRRCAGKRVTIPADQDPVCTLPLGTPHTIVIHQTEGNSTDGPDTVQRVHLNKGWDDIGYHYVLSKTRNGWRAFEGRVDGTEGSHSGSGLNGQSIAISLAGNYLPSAHRGKPSDQILPTPEALMLLKSTVLSVKAQYPSIRFIYGHGEYKQMGMGCDTDCPSPSLQQFVNRMRRVYFP